MINLLSREAQLLAKIDEQRGVIARQRAAYAGAKLQGWRDGVRAAAAYLAAGEEALLHELASDIRALPEPDYGGRD